MSDKPDQMRIAKIIRVDLDTEPDPFSKLLTLWCEEEQTGRAVNIYFDAHGIEEIKKVFEQPIDPVPM